MTKTFEELEAKVLDLETRLNVATLSLDHETNGIRRTVKRISDAVFGDQDQIEAYDKEIAKNNFPGPPPVSRGFESDIREIKTSIEGLLGNQDAIATYDRVKSYTVGKMMLPRPSGGLVENLRNQMTRLKEEMTSAEPTLKLARDLWAFFGPMLAGKNPPLDGAQIADRAYVDKTAERIAGALRDEHAREAENMTARIDGLVTFVEDALAGLRTSVGQQLEGLAAKIAAGPHGTPSRLGRAVRAFMGEDVK